jgi:hypothetical protein
MGVPPSELFSQKMSVIISAVVTCMICSDDLFFIQRTSTQRREKKGTRQKVEKGKTGLDIVDKTNRLQAFCRLGAFFYTRLVACG